MLNFNNNTSCFWNCCTYSITALINRV